MVISTAFTDRLRAYGCSPALLAAIMANVVMFVVAHIAVAINPEWIDWLQVRAPWSWALAHVWTLVTYSFVQLHVLHLLFNMLILFYFGCRLRRRSSAGYFFTIYIVGAVAGAAAFVCCSPSGMSLIGSSAATMAILTAATVQSYNQECYLFGAFRVRLWWIYAVIIAIELLTLTSADGLAHVAHLAGASAGFVMAFIFQGLDAIKAGRRQKEAPSAVNYTDDIDVILRKLRTSGHDSLTREEKRRLFNLSNRRT